MLALLTVLGLLINALAGLASQVAAPNPQLPAPNSQVIDQLPPGARLLGTVDSGPDSTGAVETLAAYFVRDPSFSSAELGHVGAISVRTSGGQSQVYRLSDDLGEAPYADLVASDLDHDGGTELAVTGGVGAHSTVLHIFKWNGTGYDLIGDFFGDSGISLRDVDGDGIAEVVVGMRHYDRAQLRHDTTMRWTGARYEPAYNRWGFTFDDPSFQDYPEAVVLKYYLAIAGRDYRAAYALLGPAMRNGQPPAAFEQGFAGTRDVRVEDLEVLSQDAANARVRVEISSVERDGTSARFGGTWIVERASDAWRLAGAYITPV